ATVPAISAGLLLHAFDGGPARGLSTMLAVQDEDPATRREAEPPAPQLAAPGCGE
ncbi:unnamed protein product, partial [Effrenium voratum]